MKLIFNINTYAPILYFLFSTTTVGYITFSYDILTPYVVISYGILNTYILHSIEKVKNVLHNIMWKMVVCAVYAVLVNALHDNLFYGSHSTSPLIVIFLSMLYVYCVCFCTYVYHNDWFVILTHAIFLYLPIDRMWVLNVMSFSAVYLFFIYKTITSLSIQDLKVTHTIFRPILKSYQYISISHLALPLLVVHVLYEHFYAADIAAIYKRDSIYKYVDEACAEQDMQDEALSDLYKVEKTIDNEEEFERIVEKL